MHIILHQLILLSHTCSRQPAHLYARNPFFKPNFCLGLISPFTTPLLVLSSASTSFTRGNFEYTHPSSLYSAGKVTILILVSLEQFPTPASFFSKSMANMMQEHSISLPSSNTSPLTAF